MFVFPSAFNTSINYLIFTGGSDYCCKGLSDFRKKKGEWVT